MWTYSRDSLIEPVGQRSTHNAHQQQEQGPLDRLGLDRLPVGRLGRRSRRTGGTPRPRRHPLPRHFTDQCVPSDPGPLRGATQVDVQQRRILHRPKRTEQAVHGTPLPLYAVQVALALEDLQLPLQDVHRERELFRPFVRPAEIDEAAAEELVRLCVSGGALEVVAQELHGLLGLTRLPQLLRLLVDGAGRARECRREDEDPDQQQSDGSECRGAHEKDTRNEIPA